MEKSIALSAALFWAWAGIAFGLGQSEDPAEVVTKSYALEAFETLEIRGQVSFTILEGPEFLVVVSANRAVLDQMNVSSFFSRGTVAVESGLLGPRERGAVNAQITVPRLKKLKVASASSGSIVWPKTDSLAEVEITEKSALEVTFEGQSFDARVDWKSRLVAQGSAQSLELTLRRQSTADLRTLLVDRADAQLRESSTAKLGIVRSLRGQARENSKLVQSVSIDEGSQFETLEGSIVEVDPN